MFERGMLSPAQELCRTDSTCWAPAMAWLPLGLEVIPPPRHLPERQDVPEHVATAYVQEGELLRWWMKQAGRLLGPLDGATLRRRIDSELAGLPATSPEAAAAAQLLVGLVGGHCWVPADELQAMVASASAEAGSEPGALAADVVSCTVCLELISGHTSLCPECGEPTGIPVSMKASRGPADPRSRYPSIADDPPDAGWLRMHWRPLVTMTVIGAVIGGGIALRHLAPDRYTPPERMSPAAAAPVCDNPCWHGEACKVGQCVWQPPSDVGHLPDQVALAGPFSLPPDFVDLVLLDADRFAVSSLKGVGIYSARTGEVLSLVSDAPQARGLFRVGSVLYVTSPRRIYVVDVESTRVLKSIEIGSAVHSIAVGATGRRALASIPGARAVAVIATDYHAEIRRFYFGDDAVGPVSIDDTGSRAAATTGRRPVPGLAGPKGGALYAFDPERLPSEQDRVRSAMVGNPVDLMMIPDDSSSYVVLREANRIVQLERLASGVTRRGEEWPTCQQPEQLELIRRNRRAVVRCNRGAALEIYDLALGKLVQHIPLNAMATDLAVSPDGMQAVIAMPHGKAGAVGLLDLDGYQLALSEITAEPSRVRLAPDGRTATVVSDRSKLAWVLR